MTETEILQVGAECYGSQDNGIVWYGQVVGHVQWDLNGEVTHYVIRYLRDVNADPPRKGYRLEEVDRVHAGKPDWFDKYHEANDLVLMEHP